MQEEGLPAPPFSPIKKNKKGEMVHSKEKRMIMNLYESIQLREPDVSKTVVIRTINEETGIGIKTVKNTILEYERTGEVKSPNRKKFRIQLTETVDESDRNAIRRKVHSFYFNNEMPNLDKVLQAVNEDDELPTLKRTSLYNLLKKLNFQYTTRKRNSMLTERDDLLIWRRNYLRKIKQFREEGRTIYYLDETWLNAGDVSSKAWFDGSIKSGKDAFLRGLTTGAQNPTGKGKRLIILHIGSENGFVPGGLLCFESKKNSADYHDEMNGDTFREWFQDILPNLDNNCVIVMDNAPYHSVKAERIPNGSWKKEEIQNWLQTKGHEVDATMIKAELLLVVETLKPQLDRYVIDELAKEAEKTVLRLPPYHCELNPIEMVWSMVKGYVKKNNFTFKVADVEKLIHEAVDRVTPETWSNFVRHAIEEEKKFWDVSDRIDAIVDRIPNIVINVTGETSSSSPESSDHE